MKPYEYEIQIRYTDFDTQNLINHTKICTYIEITYVKFILDKIKTDWAMDQFPLVLRKEETEFFIPIESKSSVVCKLQVKHIGKTSFTMEIDVLDSVTNKLYSKAKRTMVYVAFTSKSPIPLEPNFVDLLKQFML